MAYLERNSSAPLSLWHGTHNDSWNESSLWVRAISKASAADRMRDMVDGDNVDCVQCVEPTRVLGPLAASARVRGYTVRIYGEHLVSDAHLEQVMDKYVYACGDISDLMGELSMLGTYLIHHADTGWFTHCDGLVYRDSADQLLVLLAEHEARELCLGAEVLS